MSLKSSFAAIKAYNAHRKGMTDEAEKLYEEAAAGGFTDARYMLAYALLLIRKGEYARAKELLVKYQKMPGITHEQKNELITDYSVCVYKLGEPFKAVSKMEELHRKSPSGVIYQTLGYLYVDTCDLKNKPAADPVSAVIPETETEEVPENAEPVAEVKKLSPLEEYEANREKARAFCMEAVEYDDEDAVCLDNLGQFFYRVCGDPAAAKEWFDKAIAVKPGQIDTLWFLSRYDLEAGNKEAALEKLTKALDGRFSPLNYVTKDDIQKEIDKLKA